MLGETEIRRTRTKRGIGKPSRLLFMDSDDVPPPPPPVGIPDSTDELPAPPPPEVSPPPESRRLQTRAFLKSFRGERDSSDATSSKDDATTINDWVQEAGLGTIPNLSETLFEKAGTLDNLRRMGLAERDEMRDRYMRALADAENARKRGERDRREAEQYGSTRLARDLLPVYDNLKRALTAVPEELKTQAAALTEGVELTLRELTNVMTKHGVKPIAPPIGDIFDAQTMEAMFEAPLPGTKVGTIIQVMTEGFMLHDRLLRAAQVGVSSNTQG